MKTEAELWKDLHDSLGKRRFLCNAIDCLEWEMGFRDEYDPLFRSMRMKLNKWLRITRGQTYPLATPHSEYLDYMNTYTYGMMIRKAFCNRMAHECEVGNV